MSQESSVSDTLKGAVNSNFGRMVFDAIMAIALLAGSGVLNNLNTEIKDLNREVVSIRAENATFRERVAAENVRRGEYREDINEIKLVLREIQRDLQRKAGLAVGPSVWRDGREINR